LQTYNQWRTWRDTYAPTAASESDAAAILRASGLAAQIPSDTGAALESSCTEIDDAVLLALEGPDARSFLQGYVTCDVNDLTSANALAGAFTSLQGRVISDLLLFELDGLPAFVVHRSLASTLKTGLQKYLNFAKASLIDLSDRYVQLGIVAATAGPLPEPAPPATLPALAAADWHGGRVIGEPGTVPRLRLVLPFPAARAVWTHYAESGHLRDDGAWLLIDVASGIAHVESATSEAFLPQMLNLDQRGAISFSKGCYLGQEIVARAQHRGQVKRHLQRFRWQGPARPVPGTALTDDAGRTRGTLVTAATTTMRDGRGGLALVVATDATRGPLQGGGCTFTV
jgi:tRNA-modifying protein YgfZ